MPKRSLSALSALCLTACATGPAITDAETGVVRETRPSAGLHAADAALNAYVLDVGQGACVFIDCPDGARPLLIDCGTNNASERTATESTRAWIEDMARDLGAMAVAISHDHTDHYSVLPRIDPELVESVSVGGPKATYATRVINWAGGLDAMRSFPPGASSLQDSVLQCGSATVDILTSSVNRDAKPNAASMVIAVSYGGSTLVIPGDAEDITESKALETVRMLPRYDETRAILIASHHGSEAEGSNSEAWLRRWKPYALVFSASIDHTHLHPRCEIIERAEPHTARASGRSRLSCGAGGDRTSRKTNDRMLSTYENGHIRIRLTQGRIAIACEVRTPACSATLPEADRPTGVGTS